MKDLERTPSTCRTPFRAGLRQLPLFSSQSIALPHNQRGLGIDVRSPTSSPSPLPGCVPVPTFRSNLEKTEKGQSNLPPPRVLRYPPRTSRVAPCEVEICDRRPAFPFSPDPGILFPSPLPHRRRWYGPKGTSCCPVPPARLDRSSFPCPPDSPKR